MFAVSKDWLLDDSSKCSGDLTLLSLSIKLFEFEFVSLSPHTHTHTLTQSHTTHTHTHHTHTHTHTHARTHARTHTHTHTHTHTGDRTERGKCGYSVPAAKCVPSILEYLFSPCCRRTATPGKVRIGAATVKLVQPSAYRVGPLLINCSVFHLGIFLILYKPRTLGSTISSI